MAKKRVNRIPQTKQQPTEDQQMPKTAPEAVQQPEEESIVTQVAKRVAAEDAQNAVVPEAAAQNPATPDAAPTGMVSHKTPLHSADELTGDPAAGPPGMISQKTPLHNADELGGSSGGMPGIEPETTGSKMTEERLREAEKILLEYKKGKEHLERRIKENEEWWRLRYWKYIDGGARNETDPMPTSAWLLNSIDNKHADIMDNAPEPAIQAREESDKATAAILQEVVPTILERTDFEQTYSDAGWYKLKHGTAIYGVFWDNSLNGLGDIKVSLIDALSIYWEPGIKDIQDSRNVFTATSIDADYAVELYPMLEGTNFRNSSIDVARYHPDENYDKTGKTAVIIDWYYKRKGVLHYCKFCNFVVIYSSEDDPNYADRGYYDHGRYPFVFDVLFPNADSPFGFGVIDRAKSTQESIDRLNQAIEKNALMASRKRYFIKINGEVNEEEFADFKKDFVHVSGNSLGDDSIREIQSIPLDDLYIAILNNRIEEMKETTGNRDFSQGGTASGITAASAIAALQEAGSKLSRDFNKTSYRAYKKICEMVIELIREFYDEPRIFRITGNMGTDEYLPFDNRMMLPRPETVGGMDIGEREPIFDVKVRAFRASPFSRLSQNTMAQEFYQAGFFNPGNSDAALGCIQMMEFEGKDDVEQTIRKNGTMYDQIQQLVSLIQEIRAATGLGGGQAPTMQTGAAPKDDGKGSVFIETDSLGRAYGDAQTHAVPERAAERAAKGAAVK